MNVIRLDRRLAAIADAPVGAGGAETIGAVALAAIALAPTLFVLLAALDMLGLAAV